MADAKTSPKTSEPAVKLVADRKSPVGEKSVVYSVPMKKGEEKTASVLKDQNTVQISVGNVKSDDVKLRRDRPKSLISNIPSQENVSTEGEGSEFSQAFSKFKRMSLKKDATPSDVSPVAKVGIEPLKEIDINPKTDIPKESESQKRNSDEGLKQGGITSSLPRKSSLTSPTHKSDSSNSLPKTSSTNSDKSGGGKSLVSPVTSPTSSNITYVLKKEPLRSPASSSSKSSPDYENIPYMSSKQSSNNYENITLKSPVSDVSSEHDYDNLPALENLPKIEPLKSGKIGEESSVVDSSMQKESQANKLASPKEEYRLKRQARSKTLPEQPVSVEVLDAKSKSDALGKSFTAQRTETYKVSDTSAKNRFSRSFTAGKTEAISEKSDTKTESGVTPANKRVEPKRLSWVGSTSSGDSTVSSTPAWMSLAKKKQEIQEEKTKEDEQKSTKSVPISGASAKDSDKAANVSRFGQKEVSVTTKPSVTAQKSSEKPAVSKFGQTRESFKQEADKPSVGANKFGQMKPISIGSVKDKDGPKTESKVQEKKTTDTTTKPPLKSKPADISNKSSTLERKSAFEKPASSAPSSNVPAWKQNLMKKGSMEPKIEIIEKDQPKSTPKIEEKVINSWLSLEL